MIAGTMQQPKSTTAHTGRIGLDHRQRRAHRDRRIKRVAALLHDLVTRPRCEGMRSSNGWRDDFDGRRSSFARKGPVSRKQQPNKNEC